MVGASAHGRTDVNYYYVCTRQQHESGKYSCQASRIPAVALEDALIGRIRDIGRMVEARDRIVQEALTCLGREAVRLRKCVPTGTSISEATTVRTTEAQGQKGETEPSPQARKAPLLLTLGGLVRTTVQKAPPVGFEPTTRRLTAGCSTTELQGNELRLQFGIYRGELARMQGESHNRRSETLNGSFFMRLATVLTPHGPRAVIVAGDHYVDIHATDPGLPTCVKQLLAASSSVKAAAAATVASPTAVKYAANSVKLLPPVPNPGKILCIGLNYRDHAIEGGKAIPTEPVVFSKFINTLIGQGDPIKLPKVAEKVDYEAELVIVIGKTGKHIPNDERAFDYVGGYTCGHDVSARDWQFRGEEKQWMIGKTFDTFAPIGPVIVTADEKLDPHNLRIQLRLNGQTMQNSSTKEFIFGVPAMLSFLSQVITLEPGDLIFTGTPPGVGISRKPQVLLKAGDVVEVEIEGIGTLKNPVVAE